MHFKISLYFVCFIGLLTKIHAHSGHASQGTRKGVRRVFGQEALRLKTPLEYTTIAAHDEQIAKPELYFEDYDSKNKYNNHISNNQANQEDEEEEIIAEKKENENTLPTNSKQTKVNKSDGIVNKMQTNSEIFAHSNSTHVDNKVKKQVSNVNVNKNKKKYNKARPNRFNNRRRPGTNLRKKNKNQRFWRRPNNRKQWRIVNNRKNNNKDTMNVQQKELNRTVQQLLQNVRNQRQQPQKSQQKRGQYFTKQTNKKKNNKQNNLRNDKDTIHKEKSHSADVKKVNMVQNAEHKATSQN